MENRKTRQHGIGFSFPKATALQQLRSKSVHQDCLDHERLKFWLICFIQRQANVAPTTQGMLAIETCDFLKMALWIVIDHCLIDQIVIRKKFKLCVVYCFRIADGSLALQEEDQRDEPQDGHPY